MNQIENQPQYNGWLSSSSFGPSCMGTIYSAAVTAKELAMYWLVSYPPYEPSHDPAIHKMQKRVLGRGYQLGGNDVYEFINEMSKVSPVNQICEFYFQAGIAINRFTLDEIKEKIEYASKDFKAELPICIPINFGSDGYLESNHIAVVLIKDNIVGYYDSKGIESKFKKLKGENTLKDFLDYCLVKFTKKGNIVENPYTHQFDAHNCAVFICNYLYSKIILNEMMGGLQLQSLSSKEIQEFRGRINQIAYEKKSILLT